MSEAAVAFARAIGYRSAGTAEFMLDGRDFWFLELNGRIQVEHPVTELVTGVDLVHEQLRIARGRAAAGPSRALGGHAVEVRLYAEDPRTFLPQAGRIERLRLPAGVRVDAGVEEGDEIGTAYDPLIAKLIAHGGTRDEALDRLAAASRETEVEGVIDEPPVPALARRAPARCARGGRRRRSSPSIRRSRRRPLARADPAWTGGFRLNLPPPAPAARAGPGRGRARARAGAGSRAPSTAPMPGTVIRVLVERGRRGRSRASRSSCWRR